MKNQIKHLSLLVILITALSLSGCGQNPFSMSLLTNNAFASMMVAFLKSLGAPVGMEEKLEGESVNRLPKITAKTLAKVTANGDAVLITVAAARDTLTKWFDAGFITANEALLFQVGDQIFMENTVNDTDNFEVKNGTSLVNAGPNPASPTSWRFWSFNGKQKKVQINGLGDKVGEESNVQGLVFIPETDRRIYWKGVATKPADGIETGSERDNTGDRASIFTDSIVRSVADNDWVQYGTVEYWDASKDKNVMDIEIKIYHNNTINLANDTWADNKAETHFALEDETNPSEKKTFYIVAWHYGETNPTTAAPYQYREEGDVYKARVCADAGKTEAECTLRDGFTYSKRFIEYNKPRGNAAGEVIFYDENGEVVDRQSESD